MSFKGEIALGALNTKYKYGFTVGDIYRVQGAGNLVPNNLAVANGAFVEWKGTAWEVKKDMQYAINEMVDDIDDRLEAVEDVIPSGAASDNQLVTASDLDAVVPQSTYTALAGNTVLPLKVSANGSLNNNGVSLTVTGTNAWAEGNSTKAIGTNSHAEGGATTASGSNSHAEGGSNTASGLRSHAEGGSTEASGQNAHAEGASTLAQGSNSHAEGSTTKAILDNDHAEGYSTTASGGNSHAEGGNTTASGVRSHAEGSNCVASGGRAHAEGSSCTASGTNAHAGGNTSTAGGADSFVHGNNLNTTKVTSSWFGQFNADEDAFFGVGNGTADNARKNALKVDKNGHLWANADSKLVDYTAVMDNVDAGNELTETPPQAEYTVGNYYFILGQLCKCTAYSVSTATFEITSLLNALNSLNT